MSTGAQICLVLNNVLEQLPISSITKLLSSLDFFLYQVLKAIVLSYSFYPSSYHGTVQEKVFFSIGSYLENCFFVCLLDLWFLALQPHL